MLGMLTGCGTDDGPGASGGYDLTFWVYSDFVQGESGKLMNELVEEFEAEHPDVGSVTLEPKNDTELLSSLMTGVGLPDAFSASARDAKKYHGAIDLIDLEPTFDSEEGYAEGYYPEALHGVTSDGGIWAVPFISYVPLIYRNLTVLEDAGVDPADGIPTYDAFLDQLRQVDDSGVAATHSWTAGGYFAPGAVLASDAQQISVGSRNSTTTIQPSQLERSFETVTKIEQYANSSMAYDADVTTEAFKSDRLGYMIGGPWVEPGLQEAGVDYDIVPVPANEAGGWTGGLQGWDYFYGVRSEDATRNRLVAAWLKKIGSYDAQKAWTLRTSRPTLREDVMEDPEVIASSEMAEVSSKALRAGMLQMDFMHSSVFWPSAMTDPVAGLGRGTTPAEAAEQTVEGINDLYAEAGE
ncbi:extracellular solute-binding protein [Isoptericola cucumis]|uniref:ABC transporter substrate-binding protein n=1 Tax=Isoptericola cucumis TaxID=1776856 RepID=UPI00320AC660